MGKGYRPLSERSAAMEPPGNGRKHVEFGFTPVEVS